MLIVTVTLLTGWIRTAPGYDSEYYAEMESIFLERSRVAEAEKAEILSRYNPEPEHPARITEEPRPYLEASFDTATTSLRQPVAGDRININRASEEELQQLPGIGPAYAARIAEWREANGPFREVSQLLEIRGIGPRRLEQIAPLITVEE
ncbi:MAG: helix-hairpin-helix domain-containing protein [Balneolaceae bacterium]|nr:MAG: helix-hairpin-helix domain-containing protein [Balneolaceae bacterium]